MKDTGINDVVVSTRCRSIPLAGAFAFFTKHGNRPRSLSELLRTISEEFYRILVIHQHTDEIVSVEDAREILSYHGLRTLNPAGRGMGGLFKALQTENIIAQGRDPATVTQKRTKGRDGSALISEDEKRAAVEDYRKLMTGAKQRDTEQIKSAKDALIRGPDTNIKKEEENDRS